MDGLLEEGWEANVTQEGYEGWRLFAPEGPCVIVVARSASSLSETTQPSRRFICLDRASGEVRWSYTHAVSPGFTREQVLFTSERLIYVRQDEGIGIELTSGKLIWELKDQRERTFHRALLTEDGLVVVDLGHEIMVALDAHRGTWVSGVALKGGVLEGVAPGSEGPIAIVSRFLQLFEEDERFALEGIDIRSSASRTSLNELTDPTLLWSL
ncbi:MAG: PQQ-binding-like beta-propeller repeat protein, partial [Myxococcota bacterium]